MSSLEYILSFNEELIKEKLQDKRGVCEKWQEVQEDYNRLKGQTIEYLTKNDLFLVKIIYILSFTFALPLIKKENHCESLKDCWNYWITMERYANEKFWKSISNMSENELKEKIKIDKEEDKKAERLGENIKFEESDNEEEENSEDKKFINNNIIDNNENKNLYVKMEIEEDENEIKKFGVKREREEEIIEVCNNIILEKAKIVCKMLYGKNWEIHYEILQEMGDEDIIEEIKNFGESMILSKDLNKIKQARQLIDGKENDNEEENKNIIKNFCNCDKEIKLKKHYDEEEEEEKQKEIEYENKVEEIKKEEAKNFEKELEELKNQIEIDNEINIDLVKKINEVNFKKNIDDPKYIQNKIKEGEVNLQKTSPGYKTNSKSFGIVIFMEPENYSNIEENKNIHLGFSNRIGATLILKWLLNIFGANKHPYEIVVNHEHGDETNKCHKQCFIKFAERIQVKVYPSNFIWEGKKYLIMIQNSKEENKNRQYCKYNDPLATEKYLEIKWDGKYTLFDAIQSLKDGKTNLSIADKETIYDKIKNAPEMNPTVYMNLFETANPKEKEFLIKNKREIFEFFALKKQTEISQEYKWHFPQHALNYIQKYEENEEGYDDTTLYKIFKTIHGWFTKYCINNNRLDHGTKNRKKGLIIYGKRGIGKTKFCQSLLDDVENDIMNCPYIIYCSGNIAWQNFEEKLETAQLIILDDVNFVGKQEEMIKKLIVGDSTNMESKYVDKEKFTLNLPCIILTNKKGAYDYFCSSNEWKTMTVKIGTNKYLGPPGTYREDFNENEIINDEEIEEDMERYREWKKNNKNNNKVFK